MAVDILLPYGGAAAWTSQGAPVLVKDTPASPAATKQQVTVLVMQSPRLIDVNGVGAGRPDNVFYPDRGGGLRAIVGSNPLPRFINAMKYRILSALGTKPSVALSPAPSVNTVSQDATLAVLVSCYTANGNLIQVSQSPGG